MNKTVIAIGLDSADAIDIEAWTDAGFLPNINALRQQGMYGRLWNTVPLYGAETETAETEACWVMAQTGCLPVKTGYWGSVRFDAETYDIQHSQLESGYDYKEFKPFYALGKGCRVCAFDVPLSNLVDDVDGIQITGWGGHFPFVPSGSRPDGLYEDLIARYGSNPIYLKDNGHFWDQKYIDWVQKGMLDGLRTRTKIAIELMRKDDWDLFIAGFGETHTAGHDLYHLSHPGSPIYPESPMPLEASPMVEAFHQIDASIGRIFEAAPAGSTKVVFSVHGITANHSDLLNFFFLPEFMFRYSFGRPAISGRGQPGKDPGELLTHPRRKSWATNIWLQKEGYSSIAQYLRQWTPGRFLKSRHDDDLFSPYDLGSGKLASLPARWYSRSWPRMKAFALPCFAEGHVRVNLKGRERSGIVALPQYDALLKDIEAKLRGIRCGRTGEPLVKDVVRTRKDPQKPARDEPGGDLVVVWRDYATDVVDSPDFGRMGPVPFYRAGAHTPRGFFAAAGREIPPGSMFSDARAVDVGPTILSLMGRDAPASFDGKVIQPV